MHLIAVAQQRIQQFIGENTSTLLTAGAVVGTVATGILAGRAGMKAAQIIAEEESVMIRNETEEGYQLVPTVLTTKEKVIKTAPHFIPPVLAGAATIGGIVMANRMNAQKAAALAAAYGLSQKQFEEYREKVAEKLTGPKNQAIKDELAQERVSKAPGSTQVIVVSGNVLCYDSLTDRYFSSTMERIKQAENEVNAEIINHGHANASMFYDALELNNTPWTNHVGWNTENMLELDISTSVAENAQPCLVVSFASMPTADYRDTQY
jgi:hypothetical protein